MLYNKKSVALYLLVACLCITIGCSTTDAPKATDTKDTIAKKQEAAPQIVNGGVNITLSAKDSSESLFATDSAQLRDISVTTFSPARIIFSTTSIDGGSLNIPVFENADLTQLFTDYTKACNDEARAERELERLRDLFAHSAVAGKEVVQAESDLRSIKVAITGYESRMLQSGLAPSDLKHLRPNSSLLIANVPESEIWTVQQGEDAQIQFDAYKGEVLHGRVIDIGKTLDPATRTFNVRVAVEDKRHIVRPGMFAKASFGTDVTHAFVIPTASVLSVQGKSYVFVKTAAHCYERREVTLGSQSGEWFIVLGGVKPGETVVTQGSLLLKSLSFGS